MRHLRHPFLPSLSRSLSAFSFPFYAANVYTLNNFLLVVNKPSSVLLALLVWPRCCSCSCSSPSYSAVGRLISHVASSSCGSFSIRLYGCIWFVCACVFPFCCRNVLTCGSLEFSSLLASASLSSFLAIPLQLLPCRGFVVSVNWRILKTHKIALCLPFHFGFFPLSFPSFGLAVAAAAAAFAYPSRVNLCKGAAVAWCIWLKRSCSCSVYLSRYSCSLGLFSCYLCLAPPPSPACQSSLSWRLSICKWCISGEKMLLMIYLHLALIYANVSLSPIVWIAACLPACLSSSFPLPTSHFLFLALSLLPAFFPKRFIISFFGFFNFSCTLENYYGIFKSFLFAFRDSL